MNGRKYLLRQSSSVFPFTMILLSSFFMLLNVSGCDDDDAVPNPTGPIKVFLTSMTYDGNFPGLDGADTACTTAATNAGLTGTWTAWLSDKDADAVDRIYFHGAPYQLVDGTVIANDLADLTDGTLAAPILIDENGNIVGSDFDVWTATAADGRNPGVGSCLGWTTTDVTERGRIGRANGVDATWTDVGGGHTCNSSDRLYCFANAISN